MTGEYYAFLPTRIYDIDPALAESVARDLGVRLIVRDSLFDAVADAVCEKLDRVRFDLHEFTLPSEIDNRAARRGARFARRTNSDGWKA
ncbi:hypothetical protein [Paraburkholderia tropica]|uniref:hypothetical protein n=1 Tax=Paraburkholderia tropica TaxID=92647 RepID=UPI002AB7AF1F|nr:hypothetical protein [Paraburkholderia tropica]